MRLHGVAKSWTRLSDWTELNQMRSWLKVKAVKWYHGNWKQKKAEVALLISNITNKRFRWFVKLGLAVVVNVPLCWVMLVIEKATHVWGQEDMGNFCSILSFAMKLIVLKENEVLNIDKNILYRNFTKEDRYINCQ